MNCVFEITLGRPFNADECVAYSGHWCEFCDEDNGGGKFCYNCGQRESDDYEPDDDDYVNYEDDDTDDDLEEEERDYIDPELVEAKANLKKVNK